MKLFGNADITSIVYDSRRAAPGCLFVCLRGAKNDGHRFARQVYDAGCRAFLCEEPLDLPADAEQYLVPDTRVALAETSARFYGWPAKKLRLIGVTGTKGKSSVATFIYKALNRAGHKAGFIGTTGMDIDGEHTPTVNSTPESCELHKAFAKMVEHGLEFAVMEVSSQAYKTGRVHGLIFELGVFTNLSRDHIGGDEHEDFEDYRSCKSKLFEASELSVLNADDAGFAFMAEHAGRFVTYGMKPLCDFSASDVRLRSAGPLGVSFQYRDSATGLLPPGGTRINVGMPGVFSVYNALAVLAVCAELGFVREAAEALSEDSVPGRVELVDVLPDTTFIIDYAHNELSLRSVLGTLRYYSPKRLICLFGAVGHSELRREGMGRAAGELADLCIVTSDNPDAEDPYRIMLEIEQGIKSCPGHCEYVMIADRAEAIARAVELARPGDIVLLAGKGHEDYQIINGKRVPFSEKEILRRCADKRLTAAKG